MKVSLETRVQQCLKRSFLFTSVGFGIGTYVLVSSRVCMHMEVRALRWCPLGVLYLVFEVLVSHWDLKLTDSAAEPQGSACLCSPSTELTRVSHHMLSSEPPPPQPLGGNFLSNRGSTFLSSWFLMEKKILSLVAQKRIPRLCILVFLGW